MADLMRSSDFSGEPLKVLVVSPNPAVHGGVSVFIEMMKSHLTQTHATPYWVGSIQNRKESFFQVAERVLSAPLRIAKLAGRKKFDVIHLNPSLTPQSTIRDGLILLALRLKRQRNILVYIHGWRVDLASKIRANRLLIWLFVNLLRNCGHILVLAPEFKNFMIEMGIPENQITFTRTMFDGAAMKAAGEPRENCRRTILFMSRIERNKGVFLLLDAFSCIAADYPDVDLVIAGDGAANDELRAQVIQKGLQDKVRFPGYVGGSEKMRFLLDCFVFVLPTTAAEGMPVALLEAMGAGKPVVVTRAGAIQHIISDPENGAVLETATTDALVYGLRRFLDNSGYAAEVGKRNRQYAWERFEASHVTAEIESIYRKIAGTI